MICNKEGIWEEWKIIFFRLEDYRSGEGQSGTVIDESYYIQLIYDEIKVVIILGHQSINRQGNNFLGFFWVSSPNMVRNE